MIHRSISGVFTRHKCNENVQITLWLPGSIFKAILLYEYLMPLVDIYRFLAILSAGSFLVFPNCRAKPRSFIPPVHIRWSHCSQVTDEWPIEFSEIFLPFTPCNDPSILSISRSILRKTIRNRSILSPFFFYHYQASSKHNIIAKTNCTSKFIRFYDVYSST